MADQVSPFIRTIFTDITGSMLSHQMLGRCATHEMAMMDCIEAYGWDRGSRKCKPLIEEFKECQTNTKQFKRFMALRKERDRQIACGQLVGDNQYKSPRIDSF
ncbi:NADH dehydrogenase [ubiquinone] iron-sulfur protein 5-like [Melitaea cinxia]|uniref:NADH dehydrogenase [ubiquinone] iron-sulfur protein 5-like n=1 Tax=Melitaea cinxia TaxID=113334 RepID=UPI001E27365A|nr:NADH dehydrogenase [ubiquinone] iron-sulfur protein 5-like [Melitaea cinxia]